MDSVDGLNEPTGSAHVAPPGASPASDPKLQQLKNVVLQARGLAAQSDLGGHPALRDFYGSTLQLIAVTQQQWEAQQITALNLTFLLNEIDERLAFLRRQLSCATTLISLAKELGDAAQEFSGQRPSEYQQLRSLADRVAEESASLSDVAELIPSRDLELDAKVAREGSSEIEAVLLPSVICARILAANTTLTELIARDERQWLIQAALLQDLGIVSAAKRSGRVSGPTDLRHPSIGAALLTACPSVPAPVPDLVRLHHLKQTDASLERLSRPTRLLTAAVRFVEHVLVADVHQTFQEQITHSAARLCREMRRGWFHHDMCRDLLDGVDAGLFARGQKLAAAGSEIGIDPPHEIPAPHAIFKLKPPEPVARSKISANESARRSRHSVGEGYVEVRPKK